ncbi:MAG: SAM-dependent methyltransferase [Methanobrevibacter sp.]|jgi:tRNA U34 5-methylaminomethyl-2-thiouridine-forming methyltransferase MnmC|nr:SAM-dependent methyltransferase [Candidatus Methanovirga basalitermitum]
MGDLSNLIKNCFLKEAETKSSKYRHDLQQHKLLGYLYKTEDGSFTLNVEVTHNKYQRMHTVKGAISESFEKFVKPLEFKSNLNVLDICSGLGYNSAALIHDFLNRSKNVFDLESSLHVDMVEISPYILAVGLLIPSPIGSHNIVQRVIEDKLMEDGFLSLRLNETPIPENVYLNLFCEDVRLRVWKLPSDYYDGIFLDPFSPDLCPELFTIDFFKHLKRIIKDDGILTTYTSSIPVKSGLIEAGFHIGVGPIFGRKIGGVVASLSLSKIKNELSPDNERLIALSDLGVPFRDFNLNLTSDEILNGRKNERLNARSNYKLSSAVKTPVFLGRNIEDEKLERRVLKNLNALNISSTCSKKAIFLISPQDKSNSKTFINNSRDRVLTMSKNLQMIVENRL